MKKLMYALLIGVMLITFSVKAKPSNNAFKDDNFYKCVIDMYNSEQHKNVSYDTNLSSEELAKIKKLTCYGRGIEDARGLETLTSVTDVNFHGNKIKNLVIPKVNSIVYIYMPLNELTSIDLTYATKLVELNLNSNNIESINLTKATSLKTLNLNKNKLANIDLSKNVLLESLYLNENAFTTLDITKNVNLRSIEAQYNKFKTLDVSKNPLLYYIYLSHNEINSFDVTKNPDLTTLYLDVAYNYNGDKMTSIDLTKNTKLKSLNLDYHNISSIDLSKNTELERLRIGYNNINSINLSKNTKLKYLALFNNSLTTINLSKNTLIEELSLTNNKLDTLDVSKMTNLKSLSVSQNNLTSLNLTNNSKLTSVDAGSNKLTSIDLKDKPNLIRASLSNNNLTEIDFEGSDNVEYIYLTYNNNLKKVKFGNVSKIATFNIGDDPVEFFTYTNEFAKLTSISANAYILNKIDFNKTPLLTKLEVKGFTKQSELSFGSSILNELIITDSTFESLNLKKFPNLENLKLSGVSIANELIISSNTKLKKIIASSPSGNMLADKIDLSNTSLEHVELAGDVSNLVFGNSNKLTYLYISSNKVIEKVNLSGYPNLKYLTLWQNTKIKGVDIRGLNLSERFAITGSANTLEYIYTNKNTRSLDYDDFDSWFGNVDIVVGLKTTKKEFNQMFKEIKNDSIMNKQNVLIGDNDYLKTGDILYKNPYRYKNIIVVKGDVTGNGSSTVSDVAKLYQYLKGKITMDKEYVIAGNVVDSDDVIKINDVAKLYQFIKGKISNIY